MSGLCKIYKQTPDHKCKDKTTFALLCSPGLLEIPGKIEI